AVYMARALEPFERAAAKEREAEGRTAGGFARHGDYSRVQTLPPATKSRDAVSREVGYSAPTLAKAAAVVEAAEADPSKLPYVDEMNRRPRRRRLYESLHSRRYLHGARRGAPMSAVPKLSRVQRR